MDHVTGDSPLLRSHGATLQQAADQLAALVDRVGPQLEAVHFHGPAADRFRAGMTDHLHRLHGARQELAELARQITAGGC